MIAEAIRSHFKDSVFGSPCSEVDLARAERSLGKPVPSPLRELYLSFNGFRGPGNAQYLLPLLECADGGSSLLEMTSLFRDWELVKLSDFIFFGSSTGDNCWGMSYSDPHTIIAYHHQMEDQFEVVGSSIVEIYLADERWYKEATRA